LDCVIGSIPPAKNERLRDRMCVGVCAFVAAFALEEFKRQLRARLEDTRSHLATMRNKREKLKTEIANLARAIAEGHRSAALLEELGKRERELDSISEELLAADGRGLDARFREIEEFVQKRLQDIRGLLFADVPRTKVELSKHCTAITLTPEGSNFRIAGDWNLLGGRSHGAGGPGTNGLRHPLHHQGHGINPSCAMRCTLALHKPSPK
jgi:hypothetical protein